MHYQSSGNYSKYIPHPNNQNNSKPKILNVYKPGQQPRLYNKNNTQKYVQNPMQRQMTPQNNRRPSNVQPRIPSMISAGRSQNNLPLKHSYNYRPNPNQMQNQFKNQNKSQEPSKLSISKNLNN
jgi:hypothetical protein